MASCRGLYETVVARVAEDTVSFLCQGIITGSHSLECTGVNQFVADGQTDRQGRRQCGAVYFTLYSASE